MGVKRFGTPQCKDREEEKNTGGKVIASAEGWGDRIMGGRREYVRQ